MYSYLQKISVQHPRCVCSLLDFVDLIVRITKSLNFLSLQSDGKRDNNKHVKYVWY